VSYLIEPAKDIEERVRVLFRWVTANISYDLEGLKMKQRGDQGADAMLQRRTGVCAGYANLLDAMLKEAKVECKVVSGWAKGAGWQQEQSSSTNHAWTAVNLKPSSSKGRWALIDSTWATGASMGGAWKRKYEEHYFLTRPELLLASHLPQDSKWALLSKVPSFETWCRWEHIYPWYGVRLVSHPELKMSLQPASDGSPVEFEIELEAIVQDPSRVTVEASCNNKEVSCSRKDHTFRIKVSDLVAGKINQLVVCYSNNNYTDSITYDINIDSGV
jgi:hypothetical protein